MRAGLSVDRAPRMCPLLPAAAAAVAKPFSKGRESLVDETRALWRGGMAAGAVAACSETDARSADADTMAAAGCDTEGPDSGTAALVALVWVP